MSDTHNDDGTEKLVCRECGGTDVLQDAYIDVNTGEVRSIFDNAYFCDTCEGETVVITVEQYRKRQEEQAEFARRHIEASKGADI